MGKTTLEQLWNPQQRGPRTLITAAGPKQFAGATTLASGSLLVTVSTTMIKSDSIILQGVSVSSAGVGVNSGGAVVVNSVIDGVSFAFARATGVAVPWDSRVMWEIVRVK